MFQRVIRYQYTHLDSEPDRSMTSGWGGNGASFFLPFLFVERSIDTTSFSVLFSFSFDFCDVS